MTRRIVVAVLNFVRNIAECVSVIILALLVGLTVVDVVGRYFFNTPLSSTTELTEFSIALIVFAALPTITWDRKHVAVDLLDDYVSPGWHRWRGFVIDITFSFCLSMVSIHIWRFGERSAQRNEISEYLSIPLAWIHYYISIVCVMVALGLLLCALFNIGSLSTTKSHQQ